MKFKLKPIREWIEFEKSADMRFLFWLVWTSVFGIIILYLQAIPKELTTPETTILVTQQLADMVSWGMHVPLVLQGWLTWTVSLNTFELTQALEPRTGVLFMTTFGLALFYTTLRQWFSRTESSVGLIMLSISTPFALSALSLSNAALVLILFSLNLFVLTNIHRSNNSGLILLPFVVLANPWLGPAGWILSTLTLIGSVFLLHSLRCKITLKIALQMGLVGLVALIPYILVWSQSGSFFIKPNGITIGGLEDNLLAGLAFLFIGSRDNLINMPATWPALPIAITALTVFGATIAWKRRKAWRYTACAALLLPMIVEAMFYGVTPEFTTMALFLSTILSLLALRYLRDEWNDVFPKNYAAQTLARWLLIALLFALVSLELLRGLVYWPRVDSVQENYNTTVTSQGFILN